MSKSRCRSRPVVRDNGIGYQRARCRAGGTDDVIYVHQLCAIAGGADPYDVFSELTDVHHRPLDEWLDLDEYVPAPPIEVGDELIPAIDTPEGVEVQLRWEHRERNLGGVGNDA